MQAFPEPRAHTHIWSNTGGRKRTPNPFSFPNNTGKGARGLPLPVRVAGCFRECLARSFSASLDGWKLCSHSGKAQNAMLAIKDC